MLRVLAQTFNLMDQQAVSELINNMQSLTLSNDMDLGVFIGTLEDTNMQMGWAGQAMSDMYLVTHAMTRLKTSRYKDDIVALQLSQTANGSYFQNIAELTDGLYRLDSLRGLPYGGAAQNSSILNASAKTTTPYKKPFSSGQQGCVYSVQEGDVSTDSSIVFHKDTWIGAVELDEKHARIIRATFKCPI